MSFPSGGLQAAVDRSLKFLIVSLNRFDYGEKFWVIKHRQFTCNCGSEKCRYNRASILGFLKEYYNRTGEPLPEDVKESSGVKNTSSTPVQRQARQKSPAAQTRGHSPSTALATATVKLESFNDDVRSETDESSVRGSDRGSTFGDDVDSNKSGRDVRSSGRLRRSRKTDDNSTK